MKPFHLITTLCVMQTLGASATSLYDIPLKDIDGKDTSLKAYKGKVILIVNVASKCGLTPQYQALEALQEKYKDKGFSVLGFPCNQFGRQEPGDAKQIAEFCANKYEVTFPLFDKIEVNGANAHPLYNYLKSEKSGLLGQSIKWNFTKFLLDRRGQVVARHAPTTRPESLRQDIEALL